MEIFLVIVSQESILRRFVCLRIIPYDNVDRFLDNQSSDLNGKVYRAAVALSSQVSDFDVTRLIPGFYDIDQDGILRPSGPLPDFQKAGFILERFLSYYPRNGKSFPLHFKDGNAVTEEVIYWDFPRDARLLHSDEIAPDFGRLTNSSQPFSERATNERRAGLFSSLLRMAHL